ncbi:MAG: preprotein translocase subunit SecG [Gammaproteobacteria bacterium]
MTTILLILDVVVALTLIALILLQHGKGADVGAAFGSGASQTVFGSQGSANFLTRTTAVLATLFFVISLTLAANSGKARQAPSVTDSAPAVTEPASELPAIPAPPADSAPRQGAPDVPNPLDGAG